MDVLYGNLVAGLVWGTRFLLPLVTLCPTNLTYSLFGWLMPSQPPQIRNKTHHLPYTGLSRASWSLEWLHGLALMQRKMAGGHHRSCSDFKWTVVLLCHSIYSKTTDRLLFYLLFVSCTHLNMLFFTFWLLVYAQRNASWVYNAVFHCSWTQTWREKLDTVGGGLLSQ